MDWVGLRYNYNGLGMDELQNPPKLPIKNAGRTSKEHPLLSQQGWEGEASHEVAQNSVRGLASRQLGYRIDHIKPQREYPQQLLAQPRQVVAERTEIKTSFPLPSTLDLPHRMLSPASPLFCPLFLSFFFFSSSFIVAPDSVLA